MKKLTGAIFILASILACSENHYDQSDGCAEYEAVCERFGVCESLLSNEHCGACHRKCASREHCSAGKCVGNTVTRQSVMLGE